MMIRDPRHDPQQGDVIRDPEGFYVYVTTRTPRRVFAQPFGDNKPSLWCLYHKLWQWRKLTKTAEVVIKGTG